MLAQVSGALLARSALLFWAVAVGLVFGFMVGYAIRESISRHRRAAAPRTARAELYRELNGNQTLPHLE
jgi:predicted membrane protein